MVNQTLNLSHLQAYPEQRWYYDGTQEAVSFANPDSRCDWLGKCLGILVWSGVLLIGAVPGVVAVLLWDSQGPFQDQLVIIVFVII